LTGHYCTEHLTLVTTVLVSEVVRMKLRYTNKIERKYSPTAFFIQKTSSLPCTIETKPDKKNRMNETKAVMVGAVSQKLHLNLG